MLIYSGWSSMLACCDAEADLLRDLANEFLLLLLLLLLRDRPLADLVLFLEALGSVGNSVRGRECEMMGTEVVRVQSQTDNHTVCSFANFSGSTLKIAKAKCLVTEVQKALFCFMCSV